MAKIADSLINKYPVSKTLRFELKPIGRTLEYIERDEIIKNDEILFEESILIKNIMDRYHKHFIERKLSNAELSNLEEFYELYKENSDDIDTAQADLRKEVSKLFTSDKEYSKLFKSDIITEILPNFVESEEEKTLISRFKKFSTYFRDFYEVRRSLYTDEAKNSAIANRIINQNLPKFIDNMSIYSEIKDVLGLEDNEFFTISGFNKVLAQSGIDAYNTVIGGYSTEDGVKHQGINEKVNLYNQAHPDKRLPKLTKLYKQILSDKTSSSFVLDAFSNDDEVMAAINEFSSKMNEKVVNTKLLSSIKKYNLNNIYIKNDTALTDMSQHLFGDWSAIRKAISEEYDLHKTEKDFKKKSYASTKEKELKKIKFYSLSELNAVINTCSTSGINVADYFTEKASDIIASIKKNYKYLSCVEVNGSLANDERSVEIIKDYLDDVLELLHLIKGLYANAFEKDYLFYEELDKIKDVLDSSVPLYNKTRNYITKRPYSKNKLRLNFSKPTFLKSWDKGSIGSDLGMIMMKDNRYYLGVVNPLNTSVGRNIPEATTSNVYKKVVFKQLPSPNKNLPRVFLKSKCNKDLYNPSEELLAKYDKGTHTKGDNFSLSDCHDLIDFFKECLKKSPAWSEYDFNFSDTKTYNDISEFYREVDNGGYKISFTSIDADYIDELVDKGEIYLFEIYNKDFSENSKGTPNLHTMYWKALFSEDNIKNSVYKLNCEASMYFREKSIPKDKIIKHPANQPVRNKRFNANKENSLFEYDLIKDRRYTIDKFFLHIPVTMNYASEQVNNINAIVNGEIKKSDDVNVIGVSRGERNLLYISVINSNGDILEQRSLDEIMSYDSNNNKIVNNYNKLLDVREKEMDASRKSWKTIGSIKELKEGYLSQAIHVICELMIKYNAILVIESLNSTFIRGRQKIDKQVYQKFEKMLLDKLRYYVSKSLPQEQAGGLYKAYQLACESNKLKIQSGMVFYAPAWMTTRLDPTTGFANMFYVKYESVSKAKEFFDKFDDISYTDDGLSFSFDYNKFTNKAGKSKTKWTVYSHGERIEHYTVDNKKASRRIKLTTEFEKLLCAYDIDIHSKTLKNDILSIDKAGFFKDFIRLFNLTLQMRNTDMDTDYLISPVKNKDGKFFITGVDSNLPMTPAANGAYNIARKGLWMINQIKESDDPYKVKLAMKGEDWLAYAQN